MEGAKLDARIGRAATEKRRGAQREPAARRSLRPRLPRLALRLQTLENRAFLALVVVITAAFLWFLGGFLLPVFWATVLAVLFSNVFQRICDRLNGRGTPAALLTLLLIFVVVVAPLVGLGTAITGEALQVYDDVATGAIDLTEPIERAEELLPRVTRLAQDWGVDLARVRESVSGAAVTTSRAAASQLLALGQQTVQFTFLLAITLYLLFFFLRDGRAIADTLVRALPLGDARERRLFSRFAAVTRATVKGTFTVAAVQGALGGVAFWALGIGSPILWGAVMAVLALVPAVGTALVWAPVVVYLLATGAWVKGLVLAAVMMGIVGSVDNALRPVLVGRDAGLPDYMILLSTLAGLATFGISGLVIGPILTGVFMTVWDLFIQDFGPHDDGAAPVPGGALAVAAPAPAAAADPAPLPAPPVELLSPDVPADGA